MQVTLQRWVVVHRTEVAYCTLSSSWKGGTRLSTLHRCRQLVVVSLLHKLGQHGQRSLQLEKQEDEKVMGPGTPAVAGSVWSAAAAVAAEFAGQLGSNTPVGALAQQEAAAAVVGDIPESVDHIQQYCNHVEDVGTEIRKADRTLKVLRKKAAVVVAVAAGVACHIHRRRTVVVVGRGQLPIGPHTNHHPWCYWW